MPANRCQNCGSSAFRADRSLGGRLVCQRCGTPLGASPRLSSRRIHSRHKPSGAWIWISLLIGVIVIIILLSKF
ncbi:MAG: transcriptional regulator [Cyanobium sp. NAT70]|nr:transcriptional regulator [Cyanobium sp. NAT70]